jgi:cbb3-type cytochrome oxidase cytochrome c subunit
LARSTVTVAAGSDNVILVDQQGLVATFEAALAVLVADGAAPTQAHVTTANNAYTNVKAVWTSGVMVDYDRATINTSNLILQAMRALIAYMQTVR